MHVFQCYFFTVTSRTITLVKRSDVHVDSVAF